MAPVTPPKAQPEQRLTPRGTPIPPGTPPRSLFLLFLLLPPLQMKTFPEGVVVDQVGLSDEYESELLAAKAPLLTLVGQTLLRVICLASVGNHHRRRLLTKGLEKVRKVLMASRKTLTRAEKAKDMRLITLTEVPALVGIGVMMSNFLVQMFSIFLPEFSN
jgi:hypothetical protein